MMDGLYAHAYEFYKLGTIWMKLRHSFVSEAFMILANPITITGLAAVCQLKTISESM